MSRGEVTLAELSREIDVSPSVVRRWKHLVERGSQPIQWLSDNDGIFTALDTLCTAERLNLIPITTPAYSPQSNGMAEAFINTLRRDDIASADLASAQVVLEQIPGWFADYNTTAPHSALGFKSPIGFQTDRDQCDRAKSVS